MSPPNFGNPRHFDNVPDRFELFLLQDGERKIKEEIYPSMANTSQFTIIKEDHTVGNLLTSYLRKHPNVRFAAYKIPHPNVPELFIRLQTDGTMTPKEAFIQVSQKIIGMLAKLDQNFTREFELRRMVSAGDQAGNVTRGSGMQGGYGGY